MALGEREKARQSHLRALELDPDNLTAEVSLASIATHRREHDEARARACKVLKKVPGFPEAILSVAAAELSAGIADNARLLVCQSLVDSRAGSADKARANRLLGDVLDTAGRYAEASDVYATCTDALQQIHFRFAKGTSMCSYVESVTVGCGAVFGYLSRYHRPCVFARFSM